MYNKIMKEINFNCPGFYTGFNIYKTILILQQTAPETFNSNIKIESIFDSFPNMTWNGGTINLGYQPLTKEIEEIINFYFENNIEIALTLTNPSLTKEDLYDRYNNIFDVLVFMHDLYEEWLCSEKVKCQQVYNK